MTARLFGAVAAAALTFAAAPGDAQIYYSGYSYGPAYGYAPLYSGGTTVVTPGPFYNSYSYYTTPIYASGYYAAPLYSYGYSPGFSVGFYRGYGGYGFRRGWRW